jgi:hypothetical protein
VIGNDLLDRLPGMDLEELRSAWRALLGSAPPRFRARDLLALALAYRIQSNRDGGLAGPARRRLGELARKFQDDRDFRPSAGPDLKPGSSLVKEWRGVRHEVRVLADGFGYGGERFGSLSEVASRITGTKWSGPVFFGLRQRGR